MTSSHVLFSSAIKTMASLVTGLIGLSQFVVAQVWPVERQWTEVEEDGYSKWIAAVGTQQWASLNQMLRSPQNHLRDPADAKIQFYADCADFPYMLRAYYAYKRGLPMVVNSVDGGRYSGTNKTVSTIDNLSFSGNAQAFFKKVPDLVHSGNYRTAPDASDSFTFPIAISRKSIRPGVVFYNPNGHIAVVCKVENDGTVRMLDAHPDQSITMIVLGPKMEWRSGYKVGGFKGYRSALTDRNDNVFFEQDNRKLFGFSAEQFGLGKRYYTEVQKRLATQQIDPIQDFEKYIREDIFQEVLDRVASVERGWDVGRKRTVPVPRNIYYATGDWEDFATPGRDIRVRRSFLALPQKAIGYLEILEENPNLFSRQFSGRTELQLSLLDTKTRLFDQLRFQYTNSKGDKIPLCLKDIESRLFKLSFDPNHAPELRWGAENAELTTATRRYRRYYSGYSSQQSWRNRLSPKRGRTYPGDADNPDTPPRHDLTQLMREAFSSQ